MCSKSLGPSVGLWSLRPSRLFSRGVDEVSLGPSGRSRKRKVSGQSRRVGVYGEGGTPDAGTEGGGRKTYE